MTCPKPKREGLDEELRQRRFGAVRKVGKIGAVKVMADPALPESVAVVTSTKETIEIHNLASPEDVERGLKLLAKRRKYQKDYQKRIREAAKKYKQKEKS